MITQPLMKDGSTGIKNSPTAMAAMVNDVIEKSDVLKNALGDTRQTEKTRLLFARLGRCLTACRSIETPSKLAYGIW